MSNGLASVILFQSFRESLQAPSGYLRRGRPAQQENENTLETKDGIAHTTREKGRTEALVAFHMILIRTTRK